MLNRETILDALQKQKPYFTSILGVKRIGLFGSYARGSNKAGSDVDILIEMPPDYSDMCAVWKILEQELQTKIDLVRVGPHLRRSFLTAIRKEIVYA